MLRLPRAARAALVLTPLLLVAAALATASFAAPPDAPSGAPPASAASSASATSSASAASSASTAPVAPRTLLATDVPDTPAPAPPEDDWKQGVRVQPNRGAPGPCTFTVLNGWIRVECTGRMGATLVAGDPTDVKMRAAGNPFEWDADVLTRVVITSRIQRGKSHIFSLFLLEEGGYGNRTPTDGENLSLTYLEGQSAPLLITSAPR
ncbi:MAG: hypothetical protein R3F14_38045 [Polyangiaceae bacterium]